MIRKSSRISLSSTRTTSSERKNITHSKPLGLHTCNIKIKTLYFSVLYFYDDDGNIGIVFVF